MFVLVFMGERNGIMQGFVCVNYWFLKVRPMNKILKKFLLRQYLLITNNKREQSFKIIGDFDR